MIKWYGSDDDCDRDATTAGDAADDSGDDDDEIVKMLMMVVGMTLFVMKTNIQNIQIVNEDNVVDYDNGVVVVVASFLPHLKVLETLDEVMVLYECL